MSRLTLTNAENFAVAVFIDGDNAFLRLFRELGGRDGSFTIKNTDSRCIFHAKHKLSDD